MGMDVGCDSGAIVSLEEFLSGISEQHMETIQRVVLPRVVEVDESFTEKVAPLQQTSNVRTFRAILRSLCKYNKQYQGIEDDSSLLELYRRISWVVYPVAVSHVEYFKSARVSGYDVPIGEPCIVFADDTCFNTILTRRGKTLARMLGKEDIERKTWTWVSQ